MSDLSEKIEALENLYLVMKENFKDIETYICEAIANKEGMILNYTCPFCQESDTNNNVKHKKDCPVSKIMKCLEEAEKFDRKI